MNTENKNLKLYVVRVLREAYVLAEDADEAEGMKDEIERWEDPEVEVCSGSVKLSGWHEQPYLCLVYRNGSEQTSLSSAMANYPIGDV